MIESARLNFNTRRFVFISEIDCPCQFNNLNRDGLSEQNIYAKRRLFFKFQPQILAGRRAGSRELLKCWVSAVLMHVRGLFAGFPYMCFRHKREERRLFILKALYM